jgi:hypothetical protein
MRLYLRTFDWTGGPRPTYVRLLYQFDCHSLQDSMDLRHTEKLRSLQRNRRFRFQVVWQCHLIRFCKSWTNASTICLFSRIDRGLTMFTRSTKTCTHRRRLMHLSMLGSCYLRLGGPSLRLDKSLLTIVYSSTSSRNPVSRFSTEANSNGAISWAVASP